MSARLWSKYAGNVAPMVRVGQPVLTLAPLLRRVAAEPHLGLHLPRPRARGNQIVGRIIDGRLAAGIAEEPRALDLALPIAAHAEVQAGGVSSLSTRSVLPAASVSAATIFSVNFIKKSSETSVTGMTARETRTLPGTLGNSASAISCSLLGSAHCCHRTIFASNCWTRSKLINENVYI